MTRSLSRSLIVALLATTAAAIALPSLRPTPAQAAPAKKRDLAGTWKLKGWNMGVDPKKKASYTGEIIMVAKGKNTYHVSWKIGGKVTNTGVGIYDPKSDVFAAGYAIGSSPGVAIWSISPKGKRMFCTGTFAKKLGSTAHEEWKR